METKFLISFWPGLVNCQRTFSCGRVLAILDDVGFYVFRWLLVVQHAWRHFLYSMVSTKKAINFIYFLFIPFAKVQKLIYERTFSRIFPSFHIIPVPGDRMNEQTASRPNNNADTLLHWKDGNIVSICSFTINGFWTLSYCGKGLRNEFQSSCR